MEGLMKETLQDENLSEYKDGGVEWIGEIPKMGGRKTKYFSEVVLSSVDRHILEELGVSICHCPDVYNNEVINKLTFYRPGRVQDLSLKSST